MVQGTVGLMFSLDEKHLWSPWVERPWNGSIWGVRDRGEAGEWTVCVSAPFRPLEGKLELELG